MAKILGSEFAKFLYVSLPSPPSTAKMRHHLGIILPWLGPTNWSSQLGREVCPRCHRRA